MENHSDLAVNVQLTFGDQLDLWKSSHGRYVSWFLVAIGMIYSYFALAELLNTGNEEDRIFLVSLYGFMAMLAFFAAIVVPRVRAKQLLNQSPLAQELRRYLFSDRGVRTESELSTAEYKWGAYVRIVETKRIFCFFQSPLFGVIIPKRCFSTPDEILLLRQILQAHFRGKLRLMSHGN